MACLGSCVVFLLRLAVRFVDDLSLDDDACGLTQARNLVKVGRML
jgi:hypothetical protein